MSCIVASDLNGTPTSGAFDHLKSRYQLTALYFNEVRIHLSCPPLHCKKFLHDKCCNHKLTDILILMIIP